MIVYHSQTCRTEALAHAVERGASSDEVDGVTVDFRLAHDAGVTDLLLADALILGTPENFGYMSGGMKDFLDRTFYPVQGQVDGLPYAMFVSAGNDGTGAVRAIRRIANGYPLREVQEPIIVRGDADADALGRCHELGLAMAVGLELGVF